MKYIFGLICVLFGSIIGLEITVQIDPLNRACGRHPLTLEIETEEPIPASGDILIDIGLDNANCSNLTSFSIPESAFPSCFVEESNLVVSFSSENSLGRHLQFVFQEAKYNCRSEAKEVRVKVMSSAGEEVDSGVNDKDWVPNAPALFEEFGVGFSEGLATCKTFNLLIVAHPAAAIELGSYIEITFNSEVDLSECEAGVLRNLTSGPKKLYGTATMNYQAGAHMEIKLTNIKGSPLAETMAVTLRTVSGGGVVFHEESRRILIAAEEVDSHEIVRMSGDMGICRRGTYSLEIDYSCAPIANAMFEVIPPASLFPNQHATISSNAQLDRTTTITFDLDNPCSVIPNSVLTAENFVVKVFDAGTNEIAFRLKSRLSAQTVYEPGVLEDFAVQTSHPGYGVECLYTFLMKNEHLIPEGGKIKLTLDSAVEYVSTTVVTINDVATTATFSNGVAEVAVPFIIPSLSQIKILIGNFKNPVDQGEYAGFRAQSLDGRNYVIDQSDSAGVAIDQPGTAAVVCAMSNTRNLETSLYSFAFSTSVLPISPGDILGIAIPPEVDSTTCSALDDAPAFAADMDEVFDRWLEVKAVDFADSTYAVNFGFTCTNPALTSPTGNFLFVLFSPNGLKRIKGEVNIQTTNGAYFAPGSTLECDKTCPKCISSCTITLQRKSATPFRSVVVAGERLKIEELSCKYDEAGQTFASSCTDATAEYSTQVKLDIGVLRAVLTARVTGIEIVFPDYSSDEYPITVKTYAGEEVEGENAVVVDEEERIFALKGACSATCKTCSAGYDICDECAEQSVSGVAYYIYPGGVAGCELGAGTNCRALENGQCCVGYYKDESARQCLKCSSVCADCETSGDYCTVCADGSKVLQDGSCKDQCGEGTYLDTAGNVCRACSKGCKTCTSSECSECFGDYVLSEGEKVCAERCRDKYYLENGSCKVCSANCATCSGSMSTCTGCSGEYPYLMGNICVDRTTCESNKRVVNDKSYLCEDCFANCAECKDSPSFCTKCANGLFLNSTKGTCLSSCSPYNYGESGVDGTGGTCTPCQEDCFVCTSSADCLIRFPTKLLNPDTDEYTYSCPEQYYEHKSMCHSCHRFCRSCDGPVSCLSCVQGYFLYRGLCYAGCPVGTFAAENGKCEMCSSVCLSCEGERDYCIECGLGYYMHDGQCLKDCPSGTSLIDGVCITCNSLCRTCEKSADDCASCHEGTYLYQSRCWDGCPSGTLAHESKQVCVPCPSGCSECTWNGTDKLLPSICTSCLPEYLFLEPSCYSICPENYINSTDGLSCVVYSESKRLTSDDYVRLYPHLLFTGAVAILVVLMQSSNKRTVTTSNLVVLVNYVSISSCISAMATAPSGFRVETRVMFGLLFIVQIILNALFLREYKETISIDPGFVSWASYRWAIRRALIAFSTVFTLQSFRLLYSRFMNTEVLLARFRDLSSLFNPLIQFSKYQAVAVQALAVIFALVELLRLPVGTVNYTLTEEFLLLSALLFFLLLYEIKYAGYILTSLELEGNSVILNDPMGFDQSINSITPSEEKSHSLEPAAGDTPFPRDPRVLPAAQEINEEEGANRHRDNGEDPMTFGGKEIKEEQPAQLVSNSLLSASVLAPMKFSTLNDGPANLELASRYNDSLRMSASKIMLQRERIKDHGILPEDKYNVGGEKKDKGLEAVQESEDEKQMCRSSSMPEFSKISANDSVRVAVVPKFEINRPKGESAEEVVPESKFKEKPVAPRKIAWNESYVPERTLRLNSRIPDQRR